MGHPKGDDGATALGELILYERQRRGLTRRELAELVRRADRTLNTDVKTVERWELRGQRPIQAALRALAVVLEQPVEQLARLAGRLDSEEDEDTRRREFLALVTASGAGMIDFERLASPAADVLYLRDAEAVTAALLGQRYTAAPAVLLPPVLAHVRALQQALPGPPALENLTGRTALLTGYLYSKLGRGEPVSSSHKPHAGEARMYFALAESLARDTGDGHLRAVTLIARSGLHSWRLTPDTRRSRALVSEAAEAMGADAPGLLRAAVLARRAEERAAAGDVCGFERDMTAAEGALTPGGEHWYGPRDIAELAAVRGAAELLLGRYSDAADTLAWTLERMAPSAVNWRALVAADRDRALDASA